MKSKSDLAQVHPLAEVADELSRRPLAAAPKELQQPVWRLWACNQHLFPSPLPIAAAVGVWVRDFGLAISAADRILASMLSPDRMASFRFASDLMTALAQAANEEIRRQKSRESIAAFRQIHGIICSIGKE